MARYRDLDTPNAHSSVTRKRFDTPRDAVLAGT
jgi:hypothetical protein